MPPGKPPAKPQPARANPFEGLRAEDLEKVRDQIVEHFRRLQDHLSKAIDPKTVEAPRLLRILDGVDMIGSYAALFDNNLTKRQLVNIERATAGSAEAGHFLGMGYGAMLRVSGSKYFFGWDPIKVDENGRPQKLWCIKPDKLEVVPMESISSPDEVPAIGMGPSASQTSVRLMPIVGTSSEGAQPMSDDEKQLILHSAHPYEEMLLHGYHLTEISPTERKKLQKFIDEFNPTLDRMYPTSLDKSSALFGPDVDPKEVPDEERPRLAAVIDPATPSSDGASGTDGPTANLPSTGLDLPVAGGSDPETGIASIAAPSDEQLRQAMLHCGAVRNACLMRLSELINFRLGRRPSPPPPQGPSPLVMKTDLVNENFEQLPDHDLQNVGESLTAFLECLIVAAPELGNYFAAQLPKESNSGGNYFSDDIKRLMLAYGAFLWPGADLRIGDFVFVAKRRSDCDCDRYRGLDGYWGLVIEAQHWTPTKVLLHDWHTNAEHVTLHGSLPGGDQPFLAWRPWPQKIFSDDSDYGRFWGPNMQKWRSLLVEPEMRRTASFISDLFAGSSLSAAQTPLEAIDGIGGDLWLISNQIPAYPGTVLLTEGDDDLGIYLPDQQVLGVKKDTVSIGSWQEFGARFAWYPHL